jgi:hypothetical protein
MQHHDRVPRLFQPCFQGGTAETAVARVAFLF